MRMTSTQTTCLGRLVSDLRPEWDFHGVVAAIRTISEKESAFTVCLMAIGCAADPDARTPAAITNPVYRPDRTAVSPANAAPSAGRDNVRRLREEQAALDAVKATPEQRAGILAEWRNRNRSTT